MSWKWIQTAQLSAGEYIYPQHGGEVWLTSQGWLDGDFLAYDQQAAVLRWYCKAGQRVQRSYSFSKPPKAAIFTVLSMSSHRHHLPQSKEAEEDEDDANHKKLAVVVLSADNVLWIYFASGEHFDMKLHGFHGCILSSPCGILLQSKEVLYAFEQDVVFPQTPHLADTSNLSTSSPFVKQFSDQSIDMMKIKSSAGYRFFSISSPFSPLRVISIPSISPEMSSFDLLGIYHDWVFLINPVSQEIKVFMLSIAPKLLSTDDSHIISFTEEERRKSVEFSMNQSSFLDPSILSNSSLNQSNQSGSSGRVSNTSNNSSKMSMSVGGSLGQTVRKQKPRPLASPTMLNNAGGGRASPAVAGQYDNDTLQQLLGLKSSLSNNKSLRHGGFKRSLSQVHNSSTAPRSFSPTVLRRTSSGSEGRFTPLMIPDDMDTALEHLFIETLHNEVYFHLDEEMQWIEKACFACANHWQPPLSRAEEVFGIQFSHFTSKQVQICRPIIISLLSATVNFFSFFCLFFKNAFLAHISSNSSHYIQLACDYSAFAQEAEKIQFRIEAMEDVVRQAMSSLACVQLSLQASTQTLSATTLPFFVTQHQGNGKKQDGTYACFVGDRQVQTELKELEMADDEVWLQEVLSLSFESNAHQHLGTSHATELVHVNSASPYLAVRKSVSLLVFHKLYKAHV